MTLGCAEATKEKKFNLQRHIITMFARRGPPKSTTEGLMFAPRRAPVQAGEGIFSALGGLFRRATPFLKTAMSSGAKLVKRAATSDLAKDVTKTLGEAAGDVMMNAAADAISGGKSGEAIKSEAGTRLQQARQDIAGLLRNKGKGKSQNKKKTKAKKRTNYKDDDDDDSDEDNDDDEDDKDISDDESMNDDDDDNFIDKKQTSTKRNNTSNNKSAKRQSNKKSKRQEKQQQQRKGGRTKKQKYSVFDD